MALQSDLFAQNRNLIDPIFSIFVGRQRQCAFDLEFMVDPLYLITNHPRGGELIYFIFDKIHYYHFSRSFHRCFFVFIHPTYNKHFSLRTEVASYDEALNNSKCLKMKEQLTAKYNLLIQRI